MENLHNVQKLRVPLPINLKTTIIFRIVRDPDGWRSSHYVSGPGFFWDCPLPKVGPVYASAPEALHAEAAGVIRRLQNTPVQARIRERVIAQIQAFVKALPAEWPAPAAPPIGRDKAIVPQAPALTPTPAVDPPLAPAKTTRRSFTKTVTVPSEEIPLPVPRIRCRLRLPAKRHYLSAALKQRMRRFWAGR